MKQFLKYVLATVTGIILVSVIVGILGAISLVGLAASNASSTQVEENSVFTLSLSGQLDERAADNPLAQLTGQVSENLGLDDILSAIRKAKNNDNSGLMGDLFGWAGVAANDEDFTIPGFFK